MLISLIRSVVRRWLVCLQVLLQNFCKSTCTMCRLLRIIEMRHILAANRSPVAQRLPNLRALGFVVSKSSLITCDNCNDNCRRSSVLRITIWKTLSFIHNLSMSKESVSEKPKRVVEKRCQRGSSKSVTEKLSPGGVEEAPKSWNLHFWIIPNMQMHLQISQKFWVKTLAKRFIWSFNVHIEGPLTLRSSVRYLSPAKVSSNYSP